MVWLGMLLLNPELQRLQDTADVSSILHPRQGLSHLLGGSSRLIPTIDQGVQVSGAPTASTWTQLGEEWDPEEMDRRVSIFTGFEAHMTALQSAVGVGDFCLGPHELVSSGRVPAGMDPPPESVELENLCPSNVRGWEFSGDLQEGSRLSRGDLLHMLENCLPTDEEYVRAPKGHKVLVLPPAMYNTLSRIHIF